MHRVVLLLAATAATAAALLPATAAIHQAVAEGLLEDGNRAAAAGDLDAAVDAYLAAAEALPSFASAFANLGVVMEHTQRPREARRYLEHAVALDPAHANAAANLAVIMLQDGEPDGAVELLHRAQALAPDDASVAYNLGAALSAQGRVDAAIAQLEAAVAMDPGNVAAHRDLAWNYREAGLVGESVAAAAAAVGFRPSVESCSGLCAAVDGVALQPDAATALVRDALKRCLAMPGVGHQALLRPMLSVITVAAPFERLRRWAGSDPDCAELEAAALADPSLVALLERVIVTDFALEDTLLAVRRCALLHPAAAATIPSHFLGALAMQLHHTEFVAPVPADEAARAAALAAEVRARGWAAGEAAIATAATYASLYEALGADAAVRLAAAPEAVGSALEPMLRLHVVQEVELAALLDEIPPLAPLDSPVSRAVAEQYERHPYPRWVSVPLAASPRASTYFVQHLPLSTAHIRDWPVAPEVLVAGCGTGKHTVLAAARYASGQVLGVDLSRRSLAYAALKASELGVSNVRFQPLDLRHARESLGARRFDFVESVGVLHHLVDPLEGWRALQDVTRPGGLMFVALYSRAGRAAVREARAVVGPGAGPAATADDVRAARQLLRASPALAAELGPDLHSTSELRDLLFHPHEIEFTIADLRAYLGHLRLRFLGFVQAPPAAMRAYYDAYPDDPAAADLERWAALEAKQPRLFERASMYQMWFQVLQ